MSDELKSLTEILRQELIQRLKARGWEDTELDEIQLDQLLIEISADLDRGVERLVATQQKKKAKLAEPSLKTPETFLRLSLNLRLQHALMLSSILMLIFTGLPLKFHDAPLSHFVMNFLGGIENSAFLHRIGATVLIFVGTYHLLYTGLSRAGRRDFLLLLPRLQDLKDYLQQIKYFLGKTDRKARFGRFSYIEKFDYWAVYWGMLIMIGSGSLLWFEDIVLRFLPKFVLDIAKEAHSDEALLATLAIIIWHFYNVHFNPHKFPMSRTWITGRISKEEMLEEHSLEYDEIVARTAERETFKKQSGDHKSK